MLLGNKKSLQRIYESAMFEGAFEMEQLCRSLSSNAASERCNPWIGLSSVELPPT